jgi:hypothetical protein
MGSIGREELDAVRESLADEEFYYPLRRDSMKVSAAAPALASGTDPQSAFRFGASLGLTSSNEVTAISYGHFSRHRNLKLPCTRTAQSINLLALGRRLFGKTHFSRAGPTFGNKKK